MKFFNIKKNNISFYHFKIIPIKTTNYKQLTTNYKLQTTNYY